MTHTRRQSFYALPSEHWTLLASQPFSVLDTLSAVDDAIDTNAIIAERIYRIGLGFFSHANHNNEKRHSNHNRNDGKLAEGNILWIKKENAAGVDDGRDDSSPSLPRWAKASSNDVDKARSTIRQLFRDWSAEGAREREATFGPVLQALECEFPPVDSNATVDADKKMNMEDGVYGSKPPDRGHVRVLVPGAGLGRLVFDICCAGFAVEGNEISYHQLLTSSLILNHTEFAEQYALYPWSLSFSNLLSRQDQLQKVMIPDVHPGTALHNASEGYSIHAFDRMSMTAADFCILYKDDEYTDFFNAVTTVFFIDTAPNLIAYIETIKNCLRHNGVWINLGPLLWHFGNKTDEAKNKGNDDNDKNVEDLYKNKLGDHSGLPSTITPSKLQTNIGIAEPGSVELSEDEVLKLVQYYGFIIERHEYLRMGYIQNPNSMLQHEYRPGFWIARKVDNEKY